ncbi:MBL fold metallo-hydrolase [Paroceanicella profunda]|uniref:MBL fold metallo-hydrolase n=1 Tax=Paroceanicella profunda TaxID=2579971 RepID=A0A5B8FIE5_9RHOB|nr:MBL fold metallo-hydrolase [Paroceanicella profunda]QDL93157.1 MBL fold metallo-hydrolase [Paroceanicella profunda]
MKRRTLFKYTGGMGLAVGMGATVAQSAQAGAPASGKQAPGYYRIRLGDYEVTALSDGTIGLPMDTLYQGLPPQDVIEHLAQRFQASPVETSVNAYLVNTGERLVLIDAGTGTLMGPDLGRLPSNLSAAGHFAEQVDDIILTHIHPDHAGGLVTNGRMTFPNATVHVNRREMDFWLAPAGEARTIETLASLVEEALGSLSPYIAAGRLQSFEDGASPIAGFSTALRAGHTPGHSAVTVERGGDKLVIWGDIVHGDFLQYDRPEVTVTIDLDPDMACAARAAAFAEAADERYIVAGAHHGFPGLGQVQRVGTHYAWIPLPYSANV